MATTLPEEHDREQLSVLMIEIDHFKNFNDTYGHPAGDEALRMFGRGVKASIRASDLAARYGARNSFVALRHTDLDGAALVVEQPRAAVEAAIVDLGRGRYGRITISIGVAAANLE